jgi:hypothetical protein
VALSSSYYPKGYCRLAKRAVTYSANRLARQRIDFNSIKVADPTFSKELGMGTVEWIALGLLIIAIIGLVHWAGSPQDQKSPSSHARN